MRQEDFTERWTINSRPPQSFELWGDAEALAVFVQQQDQRHQLQQRARRWQQRREELGRWLLAAAALTTVAMGAAALRQLRRE